MKNTRNGLPSFSTGFMLFLIAAIVFVSEAVIMAGFYFLPLLTPVIEALLDAVFLAVLVSLLVYLLLIQRLKDSEQRNRTVLKHAAEGIITINEIGIVESFYPAAESIFGYMIEEVIGNNVSMLMPDPYRSQHDGYIKKYLHGPKKAVIWLPKELAGQRKDGLTFPMNLRVSEMHLDKQRMFIGIIRDVTQEKKADMELKKLSAAVEQSAISIVITDSEGNIEYVNPAFSHISGYSREEALGRNPRFLKSGKTPPEVHKELWETILTGKVWRGEFINEKKSGELFLEKTVITPIRNSEGAITHFLATKEDITAYEKALQAIRTAEEETIRLKNEFIASMSHELRNPLNPIIGFARRIQSNIDKNKWDKIKGQAQDIEEAGLYLLALINDILDYAKIEADKMELSPEVLSIKETMDNLKPQLDFQIKEKGLNLIVEIPESLPSIFADRVRLTQVILNLFSNAVKFTPSGGTIKVIVMASGGELVFTVEDSGIGIAPEDQTAIFEHFRQVGRNRQEQKGTGLGLAISNKLVKMQGGQIQVESDVGQGARFRVILPIPKKGDNHGK